MKLTHYIEDRPIDVIHAIFWEQDYYTWHWHFQLVDTMGFYIPDDTTARPRIQYVCFQEPTEYEIEQVGLGLQPPRQCRPYGAMDPCFQELAGGWHAKTHLSALWEDLILNAKQSLSGDIAMALTFPPVVTIVPVPSDMVDTH